MHPIDRALWHRWDTNQYPHAAHHLIRRDALDRGDTKTANRVSCSTRELWQECRRRKPWQRGKSSQPD